MACVNLVIIGSGGALHPHRNQSSILIDYGETLLIDAGCYTANIMAQTGFDPSVLENVIVTHGHYDHYCGLPHIAFLKTFSPGSKKLVVYTTAHATRLITTSLASVHGAQHLDIRVNTVRPGQDLSLGEDIIVSFIKAVHTIEALSVVVRVKRGITLLISGDTRPTREYRQLAKGAAVAVHEATLPNSMVVEAESSGHSTVNEALRQVQGSDLGILYHLTRESEEEAIKTTDNTRNILVPRDGLILKVC